jgi:hypothetical protein
VEKSSPQICTASLIRKPLPNVNNHPIGENSPNLVTLPLFEYSNFVWDNFFPTCEISPNLVTLLGCPVLTKYAKAFFIPVIFIHAIWSQSYKF